MTTSILEQSEGLDDFMEGGGTRLLEQIPWYADLPPALQEVVVRLLVLVLALLLIWVLRRAISWAIITPLRRISQRSGYEFGESALDAVSLPIRYIIIAIALMVSGQILALGDALDSVIQNLGSSLIIIALLMMIYRMVDLFMPSSNRLFSITGITLEERLLPFLRTAVKFFVIAVGVVIVLQEWDYDVSGLVAGIGLGGLAFSLAAQDTVSNLFGFTAIVSDRPFNVGEYIITPDVEGLVEHVGLRATRIRQLDQAVVYVPNSKLANSAITNWSRLQKRRMNYVLGVTYSSTSSDMKMLLHRIRELLKSQETVDPDSVQVYFVEFGDSSLNILIRGFIHKSDWGEFHAEQERLHLEIMDIVASLGMSVAFPTRSLHIENISDIIDVQSELASRQKSSLQLTPRERALLEETTPQEPADPNRVMQELEYDEQGRPINPTKQGDDPEGDGNGDGQEDLP